MSDNQKNDTANEKKGKKTSQDLVLLPGEEFHSIIFSGREVNIQKVGFLPMIDCHMHIQSNNCAPLPLQWGLVGNIVQGERKTMNDITGNWFIRLMVMKNMGRVGRLSTEAIANLFMQNAANMKIKSDMYWTFLSKDDLEKYEQIRKKSDEDRSKEDDEFMKQMEEHVDDEAAVADMIKSQANKYKKFHEETAYYFGKKFVYNMFIPLPMDMSYAHFWGKSGFPIYLPDYNESGKIKKYYCCDESLWISDAYDADGNELSNENFSNKDARYDIELYNSRFSFDIDGIADNKKDDSLKEYDKCEYKHFVKVVKGENEERFEDYERQMDQTKNASVLYPFQILPFYNFDPRRYNKDKIDKDNFSKKHIFFEYSDSTKYSSFSNNTIKRLKIKKKDFEFDKVLNHGKRTLDELFEEVHSKNCSNGPYFGFKMYTRLGYSPWDFKAYPQMKTFFEKCVEHDLPVTCHTSYGGMKIADMDIYMYDALKRAKNNDFLERETEIINSSDSKTKYDYPKAWSKDEERYINEMCVNPKNWKKVFDTSPELKKLRFDFAHFGSYELWAGSGESKYHDWNKTIVDILKDPGYPNIYADISYFTNYWSSQVDSAAKKIAEHCNNEKFRKHILFGSDWYMFEMEGSGIGEFYHRMFKMLKKVSEYSNPKFDAWYQFSVVNPLRFLGLIENDGDDTDKTIIDAGKKKLENHLSYAKKRMDEKDFKEASGLKNDKIIEQKKQNAEKLKNIIIDYTKLLDTKKINETDDKGKDLGTLLILKKTK